MVTRCGRIVLLCLRFLHVNKISTDAVVLSSGDVSHFLLTGDVVFGRSEYPSTHFIRFLQKTIVELDSQINVLRS